MVIRDVCRQHNITQQTFFRWRNKFGGMAVSDIQKLKTLEDKNAKLKKIVAEQMLAIEGLKGSKFTATAATAWLRDNNIGPVYSKPSIPWQNNFVESFNGTLHDES